MLKLFRMRAGRSIRKTGAFTLLELLCVMALIAILAALLLPAINQSRARAKRIACINNLHEVGIAFQNFTHDHNGRFPMAVPSGDGGSQEFVFAGSQVVGFFSFRHFQALSNELVSPRMLLCPADRRLSAPDFALLQNSNVSYFVGLNSEYSRPSSILAGDRNLTNDYATGVTLVRLGRGWRWTSELHQFKGNLLFADGHVEERSSLALADFAYETTAELALPTVALGAARGPSFPGVVPSAQRGNAGSMESISVPSPNSGPNKAQGPSRQVNQTNASAAGASVRQPSTFPPSGVEVQTITNAKPQTQPARVASGPAEKPGSDQETGFSLFPAWFSTMLLDSLKELAWALGLLLLLLAATALFLRRRAAGKKPGTRAEGDTDE